MNDIEFPEGATSKFALMIERLRRKLAKRDAKIAGLQRRITELETMVAGKIQDPLIMGEKELRRELHKAVVRALGSVRLAPIRGIGANDRILEVRAASETEPKP